MADRDTMNEWRALNRTRAAILKARSCMIDAQEHMTQAMMLRTDRIDNMIDGEIDRLGDQADKIDVVREKLQTRAFAEDMDKGWSVPRHIDGTIMERTKLPADWEEQVRRAGKKGHGVIFRHKRGHKPRRKVS